ncbi:MAG: hypothetical protein NC181_05095 [Clostridium sp.]|nr:hypothetical protein [Clostridium sp.]MCM1444629.1 hypothetical protein [Candidatus Amulumruptor caecigallinarius]
MGKFCRNCGKELNEDQDVCLGCGTILNKSPEPISQIKKSGDKAGYRITSGVVMIILGFCVLCATGSEGYDYPMLIFGIPGLLGLTAGILSLCSKNNKILYLISGILLFLAALINFIALIDISIYALACITFGIFDIIFYVKQ